MKKGSTFLFFSLFEKEKPKNQLKKGRSWESVKGKRRSIQSKVSNEDIDLKGRGLIWYLELSATRLSSFDFELSPPPLSTSLSSNIVIEMNNFFKGKRKKGTNRRNVKSTKLWRASQVV